MNIVLARHGRPNFQDRACISPREMPDWLARFNHAGVWEGEAPASALEIAASSATIVSSTLRRSVQSAQRLAPNCSILSEAVFREVALPHTAWRWPRLPLFMWVVLFRMAWIFGFSAAAESKAKATARAREAAQRLIGLACDGGSVLLVGHGIMNRLIAGQLLACGAAGPRTPTSAYWGITHYEFSGQAPGTPRRPIV